MPSFKNRVFLLISLLFLCFPTFAQEKKPDQKKEDDAATIRVDTDLVTLDVAVADREANRSTAGLRVEDFVVYENGVRQKFPALKPPKFRLTWFC